MRRAYHILIVDDNPEITRAAGLRLRAAGYEAITAPDGEQGVALAVAHHPDAIVLDVRMPGKDGMAALFELKDHRHTKDIPVVMLSASIVDQQAALDGGARFFLKKPYDGKQLVRALEAALAN